jgi:hypothetical protein
MLKVASPDSCFLGLVKWLETAQFDDHFGDSPVG